MSTARERKEMKEVDKLKAEYIAYFNEKQVLEDSLKNPKMTPEQRKKTEQDITNINKLIIEKSDQIRSRRYNSGRYLDSNKKRCGDVGTTSCIKYTIEDDSIKELQPPDKMNYAVFLMEYDVEANKDFAEGATLIKNGRAGGYDFFASVNLIFNPTQIISLTTAILLGLVIVMFITYFVLGVINFFGKKIKKADVISSVKLSTLFMCTVVILLIYCVIIILDKVYNKTLDSLENIEDNIK